MPMTGVISGFVTPKDKTKSNPLAKLKVRIFSKSVVKNLKMKVKSASSRIYTKYLKTSS